VSDFSTAGNTTVVGITLDGTPELVTTLLLIHVRTPGHKWEVKEDMFACTFCEMTCVFPTHPARGPEAPILDAMYSNHGTRLLLIEQINQKFRVDGLPTIWDRIKGRGPV